MQSSKFKEQKNTYLKENAVRELGWRITSVFNFYSITLCWCSNRVCDNFHRSTDTLSTTMKMLLKALLILMVHPEQASGHKPNIVRSCKDSREAFGFALVGHDFRSVHAENFVRCYFECSLQERCQSVTMSMMTFLWNKKECQMKKETKKSRPGDFAENPVVTYKENNFRGILAQILNRHILKEPPTCVGWNNYVVQ